MRYIESPFNDAYSNMALEEYLFEAFPHSDEYFMLWQNKSAVVVGKYQNTVEEIDRKFVDENGISVVRRLSGGGAMYQDLGNLNFTFVVDQDDAKSLDFSIFIQPVINALAQMGVTAELNSRNDIVIDGKKFSGNSQYNKRGRTMHHGTLLFNSDLEMIGRVLRPKQDKIESKGIKSVRSRVTNIIDYMPEKVSMDMFKKHLVQSMFEGAASLEEYQLTEQDLQGIEKLRNEKYATWEWNYGSSPAYNIRREKRFPFGGVTLDMQVENGTVQSLSITGDFFGNGSITDLEKSLAGIKLAADDIAKALDSVDVDFYINGMDNAAMAEFMLY